MIVYFLVSGSTAIVVGVLCMAVVKDKPSSDSVHNQQNAKRKGGIHCQWSNMLWKKQYSYASLNFENFILQNIMI